MALVINSNLLSLNAMHRLTRNQRTLGATFERLASGQRINRAADDAAGLGMAERFDSERRGLRQALRNANDGISWVQITEGVANETANIIKRMRELAVQAASETLGSVERGYAHAELFQLQEEGNRAVNAIVGGMALKAGMNPSNYPSPWDGGVHFQIGANNSANDRVKLADWVAMGSEFNPYEWVNTGGTLNLTTTTGALATLDTLDTALSSINTRRAELGATQNRLESAIRSLETRIENSAAAESRIRDADFAYETAQMAKMQILVQAGVAVLGQANAINQLALRLIG